MIICSVYGSSCLYIIRRVDDYHARDRAHQGDILQALMGCAILTNGDTCVSCTDLDIQMWISNRVAHLLKVSSCRKHGKRADKRHFSTGCKSCCDAGHICLCDTDIPVALRERFFENSSLCCACKIRI